MKKILLLTIALGVASSAIALTDLGDSQDTAESSYAIKIRSKYLLLSFTENTEPEQSTNFLESYFNPMSLSVVDSQLDRYSTFAVNNALLDWENGYVVKSQKGYLYLCKTQKIDMNTCVRVYQFMKHGLSKNPFSEIE